MMAGNSEPANDCFDWFCTPSPCDPARFSVAILAAHPDDEIIGVGARLAKLNRLVVVHVTDGAPRNMRDGYEAGFATPELYARVRRTEALAALSLGGLLPGQVIELGIPDQEAVWNLAEISRNAARVLHDLKTEIVVTHPYEGGHPDHDAVAFCVQAAATLLKQTSRNALGAVVEFTSYHARGGEIETGRFLDNGGPVRTLHLAPQEQELKRQMLARHETQRKVLATFPVSAESFRLGPRYDFTRPPDAPVYYDRFEWGLKSNEWTSLMQRAVRQLNLSEALD